jgi:hypothetical protein
MIPYALDLGQIVQYPDPIQIDFFNPTNAPQTYYLGGALVHPQSISNAGQLLNNSSFVGLADWVVGGAGEVWLPLIGGGIRVSLSIPPVALSQSIAQTYTAMELGKRHRLEIDFEFVAAPFTGSLGTNVGSRSYTNAFGTQTAVFEFSFQFDPPTIVGARITVQSVRLYNAEDEDVNYYKYWQASLIASPAVMRNTRFLLSDMDILQSIRYIRHDTNTFVREALTLSNYINPSYNPIFNLLDAKKLRYILDGQNYMEFDLPAGARLSWCAVVEGQLLLGQ